MIEALSARQERAEELGFWRKLGYGLGDIYGGGSGVITHVRC
jgi:Na+/melibiose symporter-like transporter